MAWQLAPAIEGRQARAGLCEREPGWLDRSISVSEIDPALIDIEGIRSGRVTHLNPEQLRALREAEVSLIIPSEIDARLAENGLALPAADRAPQTGPACAPHSSVGTRDHEGAPIDAPPRPPTLAPPPEPAPSPTSSPTLTALREQWIGNKRPEQKQRDDNALYRGYLVSLCGDGPVTGITRTRINAFLQLLDRCAQGAAPGPAPSWAAAAMRDAGQEASAVTAVTSPRGSRKPARIERGSNIPQPGLQAILISV